METNKMSNLNRIFTRNMLRHFIDGKTDNVYSSVVDAIQVMQTKRIIGN